MCVCVCVYIDRVASLHPQASGQLRPAGSGLDRLPDGVGTNNKHNNTNIIITIIITIIVITLTVMITAGRSAAAGGSAAGLTGFFGSSGMWCLRMWCLPASSGQPALDSTGFQTGSGQIINIIILI